MRSVAAIARVMAPGVAGLMIVTAAGRAQGNSDQPDLSVYGRIRAEGLERSRVMDYARELMDGIGARLTGSPNLDRAVAWAIDRLGRDGSRSVRQESWGEFGIGWRARNVWARLVEPDTGNLIVEPAPWTPATRGPVSGDLVRVSGFTTDAGFAPLKGRLKGRILLLGRAPGPPDVTPIDQPLFERLTPAHLAAFRGPPPPRQPDDDALERMFTEGEFNERVSRFFADEGVLAVLAPSANNPKGGASGGTLYADWNYTLGTYPYRPARAMQTPLAIVSVEAFGRLSRLLEQNVRVRVEVNVDVERTRDRVEGVNVFADIPGADPVLGREIVMVGAHLDSWAVGTGATDNGAGVVVAMEAMRILNALGLRPRRTIRLALWTGEEQGGLGSWTWVTRHLATVPLADTPAQRRMPDMFRRIVGPIQPMPEHALLSAVYNLDQGGGRIRGIRVTGNSALVPIFEKWFEPLQDLGVSVVSLHGGCASDCLAFERVGIPAPLFLHDPLDYTTRTMHTNSDTFDHLIPADVRQAAVVVATVLYNTAARNERLPRLDPSAPAPGQKR
jgi:hypothetical protein